ncbi:MAG: GntR family transcriptional regulator, partial [Rubrimonas sp.]
MTRVDTRDALPDTAAAPRRRRRGSAPEIASLVLEEGRTVQAQVYAALREAMMSGRFRPGEAVSLRPVAEALGASLTPVREAL